MSAYVISAKHLAVIVNLAVKPFVCREFMTGFLNEVQVLVNGGELHPIDEAFKKDFLKYKFVHTFRKDNFNLVAGILAKTIVTAVNTAYPHRDQTDLSGYLNEINSVYQESLDYVDSIKFMQYLKLLHCFEFQSCELDGFEKTITYKFLQLAYKHACYLTADEYDSYKWAI